MERKYYLRGLGVGIAVTAIIMGIALSDGQKMTDDEVIARARELGMVENTVLSDIDDGEAGGENADRQGTAERKADAAADGAKNQEKDGVPADGGNTRRPADDGAGEPTKAEDSADTKPVASVKDSAAAEEPAANAKSEPEDNSRTEGNAAAEGNDSVDTAPANTNEIITSAAVKKITVNHGDGSYTVAKKLEDVGVVTSAATFDSFLCQNGYDKRLRTGTFSIPADASDEQIARIVTGSE